MNITRKERKTSQLTPELGAESYRVSHEYFVNVLACRLQQQKITAVNVLRAEMSENNNRIELCFSAGYDPHSHVLMRSIVVF